MWPMTIASSSRGSRMPMSWRMIPWPQSTSRAVDSVSTSRPDAGVSGWGWEVPLPMTVRRTEGPGDGSAWRGWSHHAGRSVESKPDLGPVRGLTRARIEPRARGEITQRTKVHRAGRGRYDPGHGGRPFDDRGAGGRTALRRARRG